MALVGDGDAVVDTPGLDAPLRLPAGSVDTVVNLHGRGPRSTRLLDVLAGRQSLDQLAAVVADARAVVSVDTGAAHLATAYARPSVVLFGPAPPEEWGPPSDGRHVVLTDARLRRGDAFSDAPDPALLAVRSRDVLAALRDLLARRRGEGPPVRPASRPSA